MKRAALHIYVHSICCAKIKGTDGDSVCRSGRDCRRDDGAIGASGDADGGGGPGGGYGRDGSTGSDSSGES